MRTVRDAYARVSDVIQSDKSVMTEGCKQLVVKDVAQKLSEYFELKTLPEMQIVYERGVYCVRLSFQAERVKKFNVLR
ncbi:MAG: hypothetical protein IKA72_04705 [Clostridia bacterium]|nr:hypothetical protein [Clostridia bacterium]